MQLCNLSKREWVDKQTFVQLCNLSKREWVNKQTYGRLTHNKISEIKHLNLNTVD